jgi:hypothetical protein
MLVFRREGGGVKRAAQFYRRCTLPSLALGFEWIFFVFFLQI